MTCSRVPPSLSTPPFSHCPLTRVCDRNLLQAHIIFYFRLRECRQWNYEKAFLRPHTLFTMMMSSRTRRRTQRRRSRDSKDLPCTGSRCSGQCPATSHWARSDILNLMEIDERLVWYEIASPATLCPCGPGRSGSRVAFSSPGQSLCLFSFYFLVLVSVCPRLFYHKSNFCWWSH